MIKKYFTKYLIAFLMIAIVLLGVMGIIIALPKEKDAVVSSNPMQRIIALESESGSRSVNITQQDIEYISELYDLYTKENPFADEDEINDYLRGEIAKFGTYSPIDDVDFEIFGKKFTDAEVELFKDHPIIGADMLACSVAATSKTDNFFIGGGYNDNDNSNAFKHGYWNALMTKRRGTYWAELFATAHEQGQSGLPTEMDLMNNIIGRSYGETYGSLSDSDLALKILDCVLSGRFNRIVNNSIIKTNHEGVKPQYDINYTNLTSTTVRINYVNFNVIGSYEIPAKIDNYNVTEIAPQAFRNQANITGVVFPSTITTLGNRAFQFCYNLQAVDMSATSITRIEDYTFDTCNLTSLQFPPNLQYIGEGAFIRTGSPTSGLPDTLTTIGDYAFAYAPNSIGVRLPNNLVSIGAYAFAYNDIFILANDNTKLQTIGAHAFEGTTLPVNSQLPAALASIGDYAFKNSAFKENFAFMNNSKLTSIGAYAFENVTSFTDLIIPRTVQNLSAGVTSIGAYAFRGCASLTVYTGWSSKPDAWHKDWNSSNRPVVWGCEIAADANYYVKSVPKSSGFTFSSSIARPSRRDYNFGGWYTTSDYTGTQYMDLSAIPSNFSGTLYARWTTASCVAEGTMITLADGSQVAVENLTGDEMLLVWNLFTGAFDVAPILFIDRDPFMQYEIIHLYFSDGTDVKVISEHGFWDIDLNKYVFLRSDAAEYIGHWFNKQTYDANGNMIWTAVQLVDVDIYNGYTTTWSPVTFGHLCYYVNGMLSMPGATTGLINIFDVNPDTMTVDGEAFLADIETYGLFTYEEFAETAPIPEIIFEAFGGQFLKVSMGKGLITWDDINALLERYAPFFTEEEGTDVPDVTCGNNGNHYGQLKNGNNGNHYGQLKKK